MDEPHFAVNGQIDRKGEAPGSDHPVPPQLRIWRAYGKKREGPRDTWAPKAVDCERKRYVGESGPE